jgi:hypothetical protein
MRHVISILKSKKVVELLNQQSDIFKRDNFLSFIFCLSFADFGTGIVLLSGFDHYAGAAFWLPTCK